MSFMKKFCIRISVLVITLLILVGCGKTGKVVKPQHYKMPELMTVDSKSAAENSNYILNWDNENKHVYLIEKSSQLVWTTVPKQNEKIEYDELGMPIKQHPKVNSDLFVKYYDTEATSNGGALTEVNSNSGSVEYGSVSCSEIENGLKLTYYFPDEEFSIPVEYILTETGLSVSVDPSEITENTKKVYSVSIAPFLCSVPNDSTEDYIFIPSGSGAISYPTTVSEAGIFYSKEVYGNDPMIEIWEAEPDEQQIFLPVYGSKTGNRAICAVITEGAESALIESTYGSSSYSYTSVYATFKIRGHSFVRTELYSTKAAKETNLYTDGVIRNKCTINFVPLSGDNADYMGMAEAARKIWIGSDTMSGAKSSDLNLVIYGGIMSEKSFLGVPYKSLYASTTINQTKLIIDELINKTDASMSVLLKGYGSTGLDVGAICGDYKIGSSIGSISDIKELNSYCSNEKIDNYFDFDIIRKSADGWFSFIDTASALNKQTVYQYMYNIALKDRINDTRYALISRECLLGNVEKLLKRTEKWNLSGISLSSLGSLAYSDSANDKYSAKGNMSEDAEHIMSLIKKDGKKIAVSGANLYAALNADMVFETPSRSSDNDFFSEDIPFYQLVFKGYVPLSSEAINLTGDYTHSLLQALECGIGLTYGIYYNYDTELTDSMYAVFNTGDYNRIKNCVIEEINGLKEYYSAVQGASVVNHEILSSGLRHTVFDNGTEVYVNYTDDNIDSPNGIVRGNSYLLVA